MSTFRSDAPDGEQAFRARPCPICGKMSLPRLRPFCSDRCRSVDLNRWLSGTYAIPGASMAEDDEEF